jgi:hypothetical protein
VPRFQLRPRGGVAGVVDVGYRPATRATEVGVSLGRRLVHRRTFARDVEFEDVPELVKPGQTPVYRRETNPRPQFAGPYEDLLSRRMATRAVLIDDVEDHTIIGWELGG